MRVHFCSHPRCRVIIPISERYCAKHYIKPFAEVNKQLSNREYNRYKRDDKANAFYHSKEWSTVREYVVNRDMYTSGVSGKVLSDKDLIVDHIIRREFMCDPLDTSNLWCLSRKEHNRKTKIEQKILKKSNGENMLKHIRKEWWIKQLKA